MKMEKDFDTARPAVPPGNDMLGEASAVVEQGADTLMTAIKENPVLAIAASVTLGAFVALVLVPRRKPVSTSRRIERDLSRYVKDLRQGARAEMRRNGAADGFDRLGEMLSSSEARQFVQPFLDRAGDLAGKARKEIETAIGRR